MARNSALHTLVSASERVYQAFLVVYPAQFRREYGSHMVQLFRDLCRDAQHQRGLIGLAVVWVRTLPDVLVSLLREWTTTMQEKASVRMAASMALLVIPVTFVLVNVWQYELGLGLLFNPYDLVYGRSDVLDMVLDVLIIFGPVVAIALNLLPTVRAVRIRLAETTFVIEIPRKISGGTIALVIVGALFMAIMFGYALAENWECIIGLRAYC